MSPTGSVTYNVTLTDGAVVALTLCNAEDWNITPMISGNLKNGPNNVPEPASLVLFMSGLLGLSVIRRRRSRVS
jgi:hypothetical protein